MGCDFVSLPDVWYLVLSAGTSFELLTKCGAVASVICDWERLIRRPCVPIAEVAKNGDASGQQPPKGWGRSCSVSQRVGPQVELMLEYPLMSQDTLN